MKCVIRTFPAGAISSCLAGLLLLLTSCAPSPTSANTVSRSEAGRIQRFEEGVIIMVRDVTIEGESRGAGAVAGGVLGFMLGGAVGGGSGRGIARTAGAIGGAAAGSAIEKSATTVPALELTVELESGEAVIIIQAADEHFDVGDKVRVVRRSDGGARVLQ